jgi:hypothetical protein
LEFNTVKASYETAVDAYNTFVGKTATLERLAAGTLKTAKIPLRPSKPNIPLPYNGLYVKHTDWATAPTDPRQVVISTDYGGWGGITMGLLSPYQNAEKSYGIYGFALSTLLTSTTPLFDAGAQGFVSTLAEMTTGTET